LSSLCFSKIYYWLTRLGWRVAFKPERLAIKLLLVQCLLTCAQ